MKKILQLFLLVSVLTAALCISAMAADVTAAGFYDIGSTSGVSVTPTAASGAEPTKYSADVDGIAGTYETFYAGSDKLSVTVSGVTRGEQYLVLLVTGDGTTVTESSICYIDQKQAESTSVTFDVYPDLTARSGAMKLIVTGSGGFTRKDVTLNYAQSGKYEQAPYVLGDVNDDGDIDSVDALMILQHSVNLITLNQKQFLAADVVADGSADSVDALAILQYSVGIIKAFQ